MTTPEKIIILDDEPGYRDLLHEYCTEIGFEVQVSSNLEETISKAQVFLPNMLVTDWHLNSLETGYDVVIMLRELNPELRVIIITGYDLSHINIPTDDPLLKVLQKPFEFDAFAELLRNW